MTWSTSAKSSTDVFPAQKQDAVGKSASAVLQTLRAEAAKPTSSPFQPVPRISPSRLCAHQSTSRLDPGQHHLGILLHRRWTTGGQSLVQSFRSRVLIHRRDKVLRSRLPQVNLKVHSPRQSRQNGPLQTGQESRRLPKLLE